MTDAQDPPSRQRSPRPARAPRAPRGQAAPLPDRPESWIEVDIATRVVADDEDMYVVLPGDDHYLYDAFVRHQAVFLDFPGLRLNFSKPPEREELRAMIVRSMAIQEWHHDGRDGPRPSTDLADYLDKTHGRRLGRYAGAIERLYYGLKPGTIVMVPGSGYFSDVLIGEIVGPPRMIGRLKEYPGESVPARSVKWLAAGRKGTFPRDLVERFGTPNPLFQLERSYRDEALRRAFDQYVLEGVYNVRLRTTETEFKTFDDYNIQTFINFCAGVLAAVEKGDVKDGSVGLARALEFLRDNRDLIPELASNINSPGSLSSTARRLRRLPSSCSFPLLCPDSRMPRRKTCGYGTPRPWRTIPAPWRLNSRWRARCG
jgi:hypothetical protein